MARWSFVLAVWPHVSLITTSRKCSEQHSPGDCQTHHRALPTSKAPIRLLFSVSQKPPGILEGAGGSCDQPVTWAFLLSGHLGVSAHTRVRPILLDHIVLSFPRLYLEPGGGGHRVDVESKCRQQTGAWGVGNEQSHHLRSPFLKKSGFRLAVE